MHKQNLVKFIDIAMNNFIISDSTIILCKINFYILISLSWRNLEKTFKKIIAEDDISQIK